MKELLLEYLIVTNQAEKFKAWLVDNEIETEGGMAAWVDSEVEAI